MEHIEAKNTVNKAKNILQYFSVLIHVLYTYEGPMSHCRYTKNILLQGISTYKHDRSRNKLIQNSNTSIT